MIWGYEELPKIMSSALVGSRLDTIVALEFWLNGCLVSPCCQIYLENGERCWSLDYNDETLRWEVESFESRPQAGEVFGDKEFRYPVCDLVTRYALTELVIVKFTELDLGDQAEAVLTFANGSSLSFFHRYEDDSEEIRFNAPL